MGDQKCVRKSLSFLPDGDISPLPFPVYADGSEKRADRIPRDPCGGDRSAFAEDRLL